MPPLTRIRSLVRFLSLTLGVGLSAAARSEEARFASLPPELVQARAAALAFRRLPAVKTLNVYVGPPRGGFGDVASNVIMAKKLEAERPGSIVNLIVSPKSRDHVKVLIPGYDPERRFQTVNGYRIYTESNAEDAKNPELAVPADAMVTFSARPLPTPPKAKGSDIQLIYSEFHQVQHGSVSSGGPPPGPRENAKGFEIHRRDIPLTFSAFKGKLQMNSGVGLGGVYISSRRPPGFTRTQLYSMVGRELGVAALKDLHLDQNPEIAFSYTKRPEASERYAQGVFAHARATGRPLVLFIKDFDGSTFADPPPNVKIVRLKSSSLELSEALIQHSTLPIMVTGDGSLSMAMDHEKPFLYEMNSWKELHASKLAEELRKAMPAQADLLHETLMIDPLDSGLAPATVQRVLEDLPYQTHFINALRQLRARESLPRNVWHHVELARRFSDLSYDSLSDEVMQAALTAYQESGRTRPIEAILRHRVRDRTRTRDERLQAVTALLALKTWADPDNLSLYLELFRGRDKTFHPTWKDFLLTNLNQSRVRALIQLALKHPDPAIREPTERALNAAIRVETPEDPYNHFTLDAKELRAQAQALPMLCPSSLRQLLGRP